MARKLILAEKPAVARDIARVLRVPTAGGTGAFANADFVITWCIGHLVELDEPAAYSPTWKRWTMASLPMLPEAFKLRAVKGTVKQWRVVRDHLRDRSFALVINACDAGREGELIFRLCYELAGSRLPIQRLWISSLTDQAIEAGLAGLRPGQDLDPLAAAARCRSEADWLVGMNATRAITLQRRAVQDVLCSIGRVQTPTLAVMVRRERQIERFVPRDYFEVHADLRAEAMAGAPADAAQGFAAQWHHGKAQRLSTATSAEEVRGRSAEAAARGEGPLVESIEAKTVREPPPLLFDLTALQRTANRRFGLSAARTLQVAQVLYEQHKLITYPRTDSRYLTSDLHSQLPRVFTGLSQEPQYAALVAPLMGAPPPLARRVFQDSKARDHHAIIPTPVVLTPARMAALSREERDLLDLIIRRFVGAFYPDAEFLQTIVAVRVGALPAGGLARKQQPAPREREAAPTADPEILEQAPPPPDRYEARGRVRKVIGWQAVAGYGAAGKGDAEEAGDEAQRLPLLQVGQRLQGQFRAQARQTQPPPRYNEATLLSAMEAAGQQISDPDLRQEMKDLGLGTPATRAAIIETLLLRTYVERHGKILQPTALGIDLVERLPVPELASPELTGRWEARLARIARGEEDRSVFMADIARYVETLISLVRGAPPLEAVPGVVAPPGRGRPGGKRKAPTRRTTRSETAVTPRAGSAADAEPQSRKRVAKTSPTKAAAAPQGPREPATLLAHTRSQLAASVGAVGKQVDPPLPCPRCHDGRLLVGRRGWGCSRWQERCPLVIPFEILGHTLREAELRALVSTGASAPLSFRPAGGAPLKARLRLAPDGSPAGFVYLDAEEPNTPLP